MKQLFTFQKDQFRYIAILSFQKHPLMNTKSLFVLSLYLVVATFLPLKAQQGYMVPSQELVDLVDGARTPSVSISPDRQTLLMMELPSLPAIAELAQPEPNLDVSSG